MPTKKPRGEELMREQQWANQALHQRRPRIEHVNSSVKRCCIVKGCLRLWKEGVCDLVMELCCTLHNFWVRLTPVAAHDLIGINSIGKTRNRLQVCRVHTRAWWGAEQRPCCPH